MTASALAPRADASARPLHEAPRRRQRGLTLIEAAAVLAIAALVAAGILVYFQVASSRQKTTDAMSQLMDLQTAIHTLYAGQSNYAGLGNAILIQARAVPNAMVNGAANITHAFKGAVTLGPAGATNNTFTIQFDTVPTDACNAMGVLDLGNSLFGVTLNGTAFTAQALPTPATAAAACQDPTNAVTIIWQFY
jgi:type II secretory pathway pseudopilin PulG